MIEAFYGSAGQIRFSWNPHHVMIRATEGQLLFQEKRDRLNLLSRVSKVSEGSEAEKTLLMK